MTPPAVPEPRPCPPPIPGLDQVNALAVPFAVVLGVIGLIILVAVARRRRTHDVHPAAAAGGWAFVGLAFLATIVAVFTSGSC